MSNFESFGGAPIETPEVALEHARERIQSAENISLHAVGPRAKRMRAFFIACTVFMGMGMSESAFASTPDSKEKTEDQARQELVKNGNDQLNAIYAKLQSGELRTVKDDVPPPVVGDMAVLIPALEKQHLRLDLTVGIVSPDGSATSWTDRLIDREGRFVAETSSVELGVVGETVTVHIVNSDSSIDDLVYKDGSIISAVHLGTIAQ